MSKCGTRHSKMNLRLQHPTLNAAHASLNQHTLSSSHCSSTPPSTQIQNLHLALPPLPPLPPLQHPTPIPRRTLHIHIRPRARQTIPQYDLALLLLLRFPSRRWRWRGLALWFCWKRRLVARRAAERGRERGVGELRRAGWGRGEGCEVEGVHFVWFGCCGFGWGRCKVQVVYYCIGNGLLCW